MIEAVKRLQDWIGQVSIAAENRGYPEGAEVHGEACPRCGISADDGDQYGWKPGVFRDARRWRSQNGRAYFMYDVNSSIRR